MRFPGLDGVREALKNDDVETAARLDRLFTLTQSPSRTQRPRKRLREAQHLIVPRRVVYES
jgi:hypothetical protein